MDRDLMIKVAEAVSTFVFNDDGLIQDYEDFFDPDWATRTTGPA